MRVEEGRRASGSDGREVGGRRGGGAKTRCGQWRAHRGLHAFRCLAGGPKELDALARGTTRSVDVGLGRGRPGEWPRRLDAVSCQGSRRRLAIDLHSTISRARIALIFLVQHAHFGGNLTGRSGRGTSEIGQQRRRVIVRHRRFSHFGLFQEGRLKGRAGDDQRGGHSGTKARTASHPAVLDCGRLTSGRLQV